MVEFNVVLTDRAVKPVMLTTLPCCSFIIVNSLGIWTLLLHDGHGFLDGFNIYSNWQEFVLHSLLQGIQFDPLVHLYFL